MALHLREQRNEGEATMVQMIAAKFMPSLAVSPAMPGHVLLSREERRVECSDSSLRAKYSPI